MISLLKRNSHDFFSVIEMDADVTDAKNPDEAFFDNISAAKDDFQFSIRVYFDALDHLADDGIVILKLFCALCVITCWICSGRSFGEPSELASS